MPRGRRKTERLTISTYRGACEGQQEKLYFKHLQYLINTSEHKKRQVKIDFKDDEGGSRLGVAREAVKIQDGIGTDKAYAIFDYDNEKNDFVKAIELCKKERVGFPYSNMCFDLWLLLHKRYYSRPVHIPDNYKNDVISNYSLDRDADTKQEDTILQIVSQIEIDDVKKAIERAERIYNMNLESGESHSICGGQVIYYDNPDLKIHEFVEAILDDVGLL